MVRTTRWLVRAPTAFAQRGEAAVGDDDGIERLAIDGRLRGGCWPQVGHGVTDAHGVGRQSVIPDAPQIAVEVGAAARPASEPPTTPMR
jgi:hypothetical protein